MATVQNIRECLQYPVFDSVQIEPQQQLRDVTSGSTLKFFVDVQRKNKLETNLQSASLLPHYNTFEARAMRVVISDLPPEFPDADKDQNAVTDGEGDSGGLSLTDPNGAELGTDDNGAVLTANVPDDQLVTADLEMDLKRLMDLLKEARDSDSGDTTIDIDDPDVTLIRDDQELVDDPSATTPITPIANLIAADAEIVLEVADLEAAIETLDKKAPPLEQIRFNNGAGNVISKLVFNTVTTLFVGEKIMIEMPTWFFPGGAGPYSFTSNMISHGEPTPLATFRFAEPIFIDKQQNFRVEIDIPDSDVLKEIQKIYGPLFIWVVLDGYMTRDVQ
jgi:hypothetical protein